MTDELEDGSEVDVTGTIVATGPLLYSPLTGEPCVVHCVRLKVWTHLDVAGVLVDEIDAGVHGSFAITAEDRRWPIDPTFVDLAFRGVEVMPHYRDAIYDLLAARKLERYVDSTFGEHVILRAGTRVRVRGIAMHERAVASGETGYRDDAVELRLVGFRERKLTIEVV